MKKALKTTQVALLIMGLSLVMASCEPKPENHGGSKESKSGVEKLIYDNIKLLSKEMDWGMAQEQYGKIKSDISNRQFKLETRVQADLYSLADKAFCHSMDTIMFEIMSGQCKPRHGELFAIHKRRSGSDEFSKVPSTPLHAQVEKQFSDHEIMRTKTLPGLKQSKQNVTSYETAYVMRYEKEAIQNAETYLEQNPVCLEIKDGLTRVKDGKLVDGWRLAYCKAVVDKYCEQFGEPTETWAQRCENITIGNIGFYTDKHSSDPAVEELMKRIEDIKVIQQGENH